MSQGLRTSLDSMYDARIPDKWLKISWESATLGFWYTELLERDHQFRQWCNHGRPRVFWMTGFFNPQGFLTAMRQVKIKMTQFGKKILYRIHHIHTSNQNIFI